MQDVPMLKSEEDWQDWTEAINSLLRIHGMFKIADGSHTCPSLPPVPPGTAVSSDLVNLRREIAKEIREWENLNSKAVGIVTCSLSPSIRHDFIHYENVHDLLGAIMAKYNVSSSVQSFKGLQMAMQTKYSMCKDIQDYVSTMSKGLDRFNRSLNYGETLPESVRIQFLLNGLGERWETFLTLYLNTRYVKGETTYDQVATTLIQEESRLEYHSRPSNFVKAKMGLQLRKDKYKSTDKTNRGQDYQPCTKCKNPNHADKNCFFQHPEKAPEGWRPRRKEPTSFKRPKSATSYSQRYITRREEWKPHNEASHRRFQNEQIPPLSTAVEEETGAVGTD